MTARISLKEATERGLIPAAKGTVRPAAKTTPVRTRPPGKTPPGKRAKPGRQVRATDDFSTVVEFRIDAAPQPKRRARTHMSRHDVHAAFDKAGGDPSAFRSYMASVRHRTYTPKDTERFERLVKTVAAATMRGRPPFERVVALELVFVFEGDEGTWPTDVGDADLDNATKAVMDGFNGVVYVDDRLVVRSVKEKVCSPVPHVRVCVRSARGPADVTSATDRTPCGPSSSPDASPSPSTLP